MFSIRMRASRLEGGTSRETLQEKEVHISGAEGIFPEPERDRAVAAFIERALSHPRGRPDRITLTVEPLRRSPRALCTLPVITVACRTVAQARSTASAVLGELGVSASAIAAALSVVSTEEMHGAALLRMQSGERVEADRLRGVRATRFGITAAASAGLARILSPHEINTMTVREAVLLASKVVSCPGVIAELCISDDPGYTTGYVASRKFGYLRIPMMKRRGVRKGGRVFFVRERADISRVIRYLEQQPVLFSATSGCFGTRTLDEVIGHYR